MRRAWAWLVRQYRLEGWPPPMIQRGRVHRGFQRRRPFHRAWTPPETGWREELRH